MAHHTARDALKRYEAREHSLVKHTTLQSYLERCLMIIGQQFNKIAYIDCFAGPWKSTTTDLSDTSPGLAIQTMVGCQTALKTKLGRSVRIRSVFVESDQERADLLDVHVQQAPSNIVRPEIWRKTFESAIADIVRWLEPDEFAFVFVDPFGWKSLIEPSVLAPFLRRDKTELLINFMWNFLNLATGHQDQHSNLDAVFGTGWQRDAAGNSEYKRIQLMNRYRNALIETSNGYSRQRLRTAMLPVEYVDKKKIVFYLVYATHNPTGLIVFCQQAEEVAKQQSRLKLQHKLDAVARKQGQDDLFTADTHEEEARLMPHDANDFWLHRLPTIGSELVVDAPVMADIIEESDLRVSELQTALRGLIETGIVVNTSAQKARPKNVVDYRRRERLVRLK